MAAAPSVIPLDDGYPQRRGITTSAAFGIPPAKGGAQGIAEEQDGRSKTSFQGICVKQKRLGAAALVCWSKALLASVFMAGAAHAIPISGQGTWESTLQGRDINHDGVTDAYYDTSLNISWLADANYAATTGVPPPDRFSEPGQMFQPDAITWASGLDIYGVQGWRLADSDFSDANAACPVIGIAGCRYVPNPSVDEFAHLYYVTLGNSTHDSGQLATNNTGSFLNVMSGAYYYNHMPGGFSSAISFGTGRSLIDGQQFPQFAWAVHDGDIGGGITAPIPEPHTYVLMAMGLVMVGTIVRKSKNGKGADRGLA
jgi:hypothetical protein